MKTSDPIMENKAAAKARIIQLLLLNSPEEEDDQRMITFRNETYPEVFKLLADGIRRKDTELLIDMGQYLQSADFQLFSHPKITEEYRYVQQSGIDLYAFIKLRLEPVPAPVLIINEALPPLLGELMEGKKPKNECVEWMEVYPYIMKALVDDCLTQQMSGLKFTLLEVGFHPIDYKPFGYYVCARRLLNKIHESHLTAE